MRLLRRILIPKPDSHWRKMSQSNVSDSSGQPFTFILIQVNASYSTFSRSTRKYRTECKSCKSSPTLPKVRSTYDAQLHHPIVVRYLVRSAKRGNKYYHLFGFRRSITLAANCAILDGAPRDNPCYRSSKVHAWVARDRRHDCRPELD